MRRVPYASVIQSKSILPDVAELIRLFLTRVASPA
jgi:hypothetical protein